MDHKIATAVKESFSRQGLMRTLGASLVRVDRGFVEISCPITPNVSQQHGLAHAGVTFALGDSAAGYTALTVLPEGSEVLTSEMSIHLLAPAKGLMLHARGRVIRAGRRLVVAAAEVYASDGTDETLVATMTGTMVPVTAG
jgi:uncharacterized protein (TIGR00369 family)